MAAYLRVERKGTGTDMETRDIIAGIKEADMVLAGLGEEFDGGRELKSCPVYLQGLELLREMGGGWMEPAWAEYCLAKTGWSVETALQKLAALLEDKNYFIVSTAMNRSVALAQWKQNRLVMPCGSNLKKQCRGVCGHTPVSLGERDREHLQEVFDGLTQGKLSGNGVPELDKCPECGAPMILNTVCADNYDEKGYMEQWTTYTKWLQGTLNRKLTVLELGVGMRYPTVIRWPFEKVAYFNKKAVFLRVNESLYQLTEELSGKGCGIPRNGVEWLENLC